MGYWHNPTFSEKILSYDTRCRTTKIRIDPNFVSCCATSPVKCRIV
jgi:hypothetical protein